MLSQTPPGESASHGKTSTASTAANAAEAVAAVRAPRVRQIQTTASGASSTAYSFAAAATPSRASASRLRPVTRAATAAALNAAGHAS